MISDKKIEANRLNALKSTGPRTEEGKARSSRNALKHGLTAEHVILPNEDAEAFEALLNDWLDDFQPLDAAQRCLIERAVQSQWKLNRSARRERAVLSERVRHAALDFDRKGTIRAEELGRRLTHDPLNRMSAAAMDDPHTREVLAAWHNDDDPPKLTQELQASVHGVDWMLNQWRELDGLLEREGFWHFNDKFRAIRLMGKRPQDVIDDFEISMVFVTTRAAHPDPWDLSDDVIQAQLGTTGKLAYNRRVHYLKEFQYSDPGEPTRELRLLVERKVTALKTLRDQHLAPLADLDRAEAVDRAMFDDTAAGTLHRRYETACERELHRSITGLMKLRKDASNADPTSTGPMPRRARPLRNEATPDVRSNPDNPQSLPVSTTESAPNDAG